MNETKAEPKEEDPYIDKGDLFNGPAVKHMMSNMSEEQKAQYRKLGEQFYGHYDFDKMAPNQIPEPILEGAAYVVTQLNSGMHPSMLKENEITVMNDVYGKKWYEKWGYTEEDLKTIVHFFTGAVEV